MCVRSVAARNEIITSARGQSQPVLIASFATSTRTQLDSCTRSGDNKRALEILHKIADLDPNNTEIRLKLAEGYLKEGMPREAAGAFVQAANRLQHTASHDKALDAYSKALELVSDDINALRGMLEAHIVREQRMKQRKSSKEWFAKGNRIPNSFQCWRALILRLKIQRVLSVQLRC